MGGTVRTSNGPLLRVSKAFLAVFSAGQVRSRLRGPPCPFSGLHHQPLAVFRREKAFSCKNELLLNFCRFCNSSPTFVRTKSWIVKNAAEDWRTRFKNDVDFLRGPRG